MRPDRPDTEDAHRGARLAIVLVVAVAACVRLLVNFSTPLMPKVNGAYYLVQVRVLLTTGHLAYRDFPLLFWIEAVVAKGLQLVGGLDLSPSIILAAKLTDGILPAFAGVPIFLLGLGWARSDLRVPSATAAALFSVLCGPALVMTSDFQKNALGMLWLAGTIWTLHRSLERRTRGWLLAAGGFFLLSGMTHVGAFGVTLAYVLLFGAAVLLVVPGARRRFGPALLGGVVLLLAILAGLSLVDASGKAMNLVSVIRSPLKLFHPSLATSLVTGAPVRLSPPAVVQMILITGTALAGGVVILRRGAREGAAARATVLAAVLSCLLLGSPLTNLEIGAGRLLMMAYLPAAVVLAFLLGRIRSASLTWAAHAVVMIVTVGSALGVIRPITTPCIPAESYAELQDLRSFVDRPPESLIITRHGLEWWAAWALEANVTQEFDIEPEIWDRYERVFFLQQLAEYAPFGPQGFGGPPFMEVWLPDEAEVLFEGRYFRLACSEYPPLFYPLARPDMP